MSRRLRLLLLAAWVTSACATSRPGDDPFETERIRPEDHEEIHATPAQRPPRETAHGAPGTTSPASIPSVAPLPPGSEASRRKPADPSAFAKAVTAQECRREVQRLAQYEGNEPGGWALLKACVAQGKYNDLKALLSAPWLARLQAEGDAVTVRLVSEVIATRGANFARDLPACQQKQIPLYELRAALENPKVFKGRFVLVRGVVTSQDADDRHANVEIDETSMQVKDKMQRISDHSGDDEGEDTVWRRGYRYRRRRENFAAPTGRTLSAALEAPDPRLLNEEEYVFLARFVSRQPPEDELDDREHAFVDIVNFYKPGIDMPAVLE